MSTKAGDPLGDDADKDARDPLGDYKRDPLEDSAEQDAKESVGYRKPPRKYTWKPGQCGNPSGRRREHDPERNLYDALNDLLDDSVPLKDGRTLSGEEVMAEQIMAAASKGDPRAFREFIRLSRRAKLFERLLPGPELPEGVRPADFIKGQIEELRRELEKFDRRPVRK